VGICKVVLCVACTVLLVCCAMLLPQQHNNVNGNQVCITGLMLIEQWCPAGVNWWWLSRSIYVASSLGRDTTELQLISTTSTPSNIRECCCLARDVLVQQLVWWSLPQCP